MAGDELLFLPLGGSGEIGMNMNLYGFGPPKARRWIMIDCGVLFGDHTTPGIDLICPDPAYILDQKENLLALVLTHGHEDHIGAVALIAPMLDCPVYATPFTAALVRRKLEEAGANIDLRVLDISARFRAGPFDLEFVTLTHSIPEPNGVIVRTPLGTVLHTGDWKIDPEPTLGPVTDDAALRGLGDQGLLAMVCDSTNVLSSGESGSEMRVKESLIELIAAQPARVAVTTFASNVSRVVSICEAAAASDRSVCLLGRSMRRIVEASREVGLLPEKLSFVEPEEAGYLPRDKVLYLCTGSQGEPRAALARIARDDHRDVTLNEGDTVIFSSKIIPGNEREIYSLQNDLVDLGVHVITEKDHFVHVSGHPCRDELKKMYEWARPKYAIPVHGEARHLEAHADFALTLGVKDAIAPRNGDLIRLAPGAPEIIDETPSGRLFLDGALLLPEGSSPLRERRKLSYGGVVTVALAIDDDGDLAAPAAVAIAGAPALDAGGDPIGPALAEAAEEAFGHLARKKRDDDEAVEIAVQRAVRTKMVDLWGKRPIVGVLINRVP
ncbi:MAG: MBL fold metallo-hydrolase [Alphaproteobacteria bacterium]|nr:MBL fold metallo-hydrolase [Alphaproteobacteria bacterium]